MIDFCSDPSPTSNIQENTHRYLGQQFSEAIVVVSVVPSFLASHSQARVYFPGGYLAALASLMREYQFSPERSCAFVHWILCENDFTNGLAVHLSFFPTKHSGTTLLAQDLLSREEKEQARIRPLILRSAQEE